MVFCRIKENVRHMHWLQNSYGYVDEIMQTYYAIKKKICNVKTKIKWYGTKI